MRRGFTLLEVMVVMFILGLLATLVAPRVVGRVDDARRTKAIADLKGIEQALNLYRLDGGGYPTTEQGLEALVHKPDRPPCRAPGTRTATWSACRSTPGGTPTSTWPTAAATR